MFILIAIGLIIGLISGFCLFLLSKDSASIPLLIVLTGINMIAGAAVYGCIYASRTSDVEYLGTYVTSTTYYEPWDEMVEKSREVKVGEDKDGNPIYETEYYKEREYHHERYTYTLAPSSWEHYCTKEEFDKINAKLCASPIFVDMHRRYYKIDGDSYVRKYDNTRQHCYTITDSEVYTNYVQGSDNSIFKYHVDKNMKEEYKLYDYPRFSELEDQNPILGLYCSKADKEAIQYINAWYGAKKQFRMYILFFNTDNIEVGEIQRCYWEGGNKNEFVVCLGKKGNKVTWCYPFSWQDKPELEIKTRSYFIENPEINIQKFGKFIENNLYCWHRKEFKDFNYLSCPISKNEYMWFGIIIGILNFIVVFAIYVNEFSDNNKRNYYY